MLLVEKVKGIRQNDVGATLRVQMNWMDILMTDTKSVSKYGRSTIFKMVISLKFYKLSGVSLLSPSWLLKVLFSALLDEETVIKCHYYRRVIVSEYNALLH